ncbi:MAG: TetR/AcrR family transcriptional regulator [Draconibacterium sp.]
MPSNKSQLLIIEAAARTFDKYGFKKTTMDDIAYAAGKGKSSLYYYFKNKEEVFEAVVEHEAEYLKAEIYEALNNVETAVDKLRNYILIRMRRFVSRGNLYKALTDNFLTTFSFIEKIRNRHREWELQTLTDILEKGIAQKEFKPVDIEFMSNALLTAMIGFEMPLLKKTETETEFDKKINDVTNMLFFGICT